ncbi:MAG: hypothetical protein ACK56I_28180, partial [bacterium]
LQQVSDLTLRPRPQSARVRGDVGNETALPFRVRPAGEAAAGRDVAGEGARRMTLDAMARPFDQVGAAVQLRALRGVRLERLAVEEGELPQAEAAADVEREGQRVVTHPALHRRQRLDVGEQVSQIVRRHALVRG